MTKSSNLMDDVYIDTMSAFSPQIENGNSCRTNSRSAVLLGACQGRQSSYNFRMSYSYSEHQLCRSVSVIS